MKWSSSPLTFAFLLLPGFLVSASRPCNSPNTPIKWTLGEFTYDAPDKTSPDTVVGLYLTTSTGTDYSCYGAWRPESSAGFLESSNTTIIWFPCVNSKGRAIDRTVSFAMDWRRKVLRAAHMFDCSNGVSDGHTMTALGTIDLASELDCSSGRCVTRSRSYNFNTTMNINAPPPTPNCADRDSLTGYKVYWQIKAYGPLYYSALPPPPSDTAVMQSKEPADVVLFSMQYVGSSMQFPCTAAGPAAGAAAGAAAKLSSPAAIVIEGSCTGTMGLEGSIPFQYNPASKVLTLTSVSGCITVRGAGELAAMTCRSGDTSCQLDDLWIGGDIVF